MIEGIPGARSVAPTRGDLGEDLRVGSDGEGARCRGRPRLSPGTKSACSKWAALA